jgi:hypothetical protein
MKYYPGTVSNQLSLKGPSRPDSLRYPSTDWQNTSSNSASGIQSLRIFTPASSRISKSGDYSDVTVKTPFGDIAWRDLSRFDDAEMKRLIIDVVNRTYLFIHRLFDEETGGELWLRLGARDLVPQWESPALPAK